MGLLHTSGRELGRFRALQAQYPAINNLDKKSVFYMDFDGRSLGLSNRFINSPKVVIHSRSEHNFERNALQFKGRGNIETRVGAKLDESIFKGAPFDVLIWWAGPQDKEEMSFLRSCKKYFKDFIVFGVDEASFTSEELRNLLISRFLGMALAVERIATTPAPSPKEESVTKEVPGATKPKPKSKPKPKAKKKTSAGSRPLKAREVTTGEMKTEQSTPLPTNINSKSAKVQPAAEPHQEKVAKEAAKKRSKPKAKSKPRPKVVDVEKLISKSNEQSKMEIAFMLNGDLPASVEEAESIIRSASPEDLALVS